MRLEALELTKAAVLPQPAMADETFAIRQVFGNARAKLMNRTVGGRPASFGVARGVFLRAAAEWRGALERDPVRLIAAPGKK